MAKEAIRPKGEKTMKTTSSLLRITLLAVFVWDLTAQPAHAYLDPAVGSHILQASLAGLLGALFMIKSAFRTLLSRVRTRK